MWDIEHKTLNGHHLLRSKRKNIDKKINKFSLSYVNKHVVCFLFLIRGNLRGLFNTKAIHIEELHWVKRVHDFPKGIKMKVNVIALLEFELAYLEVRVYLVTNYIIRILPK